MMRTGHPRKAPERTILAILTLVVVVLAALGPNTVPTQAGGSVPITPTCAAETTATCPGEESTEVPQVVEAAAGTASAVPTATSTETPVAPTATSTETPAATPAATAEPQASTGCNVSIVSVTSPVVRGNSATLVAQTTPGALASIAVFFPSGLSTAEGLEPQTADAEGQVSWTWLVGGNTTPGTWPIQVTCSSGGASALAETTFEVQQASTSRVETPVHGTAVQAATGAGLFEWLGRGIRTLALWVGQTLGR